MAKRSKNQDATVSRTGSELVLKLYNALRSMRIAQHDISTLREMLEKLTKTGEPLTIQIGRDRLFLNNDRIEMRFGHTVHRILLNEFKRRQIGKIEFPELPDVRDLEEFLRIFLVLSDGSQRDSETLQSLLRDREIESIRVERLIPREVGEELGFTYEKHAYYTRIYFYAMHLLKETFGKVRRGDGLPDLSLPRRVVRAMLSGYVDSPSIFMGLATTKTNREFLTNHSVNVAIYALALGHRLGLSNRLLIDLGLASFFHDIGEIQLSWPDAAKDRDLDKKEWEEVAIHPVLGVKTMMNAVGSNGPALSRLWAGIFEHHLRYDLSGFPKLRRKKNISLLGRIIGLADFYDHAARPYGKNRFPCFSSRLLELIAERSGKDFDPTLAKYFARTLGMFPVGTLCRLDTGDLAIVCSLTEEGTTGDRPWVRVLEPAGDNYRGGDLVNLESVGEKNRKYLRSIAEILDPNEFEIDVAEYLLEF